ncbi:MAG: ATP-binding protein, partial [Thermoplasmata archaeon]
GGLRMAVVTPPDTLDEELIAGLRRLKLRRIRELAPELCLTARTQRWRPEELLRVLIREECLARDGSNREQRLRSAGFPVAKTLDAFTPAWSNISQATFDYLGSLEWVANHRNVILVGPAGLGKSHLCVALGRAAVEAGHRVRCVIRTKADGDSDPNRTPNPIESGRSFRLKANSS